MIIREFFYHDEESGVNYDNKRYDPENDKLSSLKRGDTRKTRLTLRQINRVRRAGESREEEKVKELETVRQMYSVQSNSPDSGGF